jgi:hypothetical protein
LEDAKWVLNVEVVNVRTHLSKNDEVVFISLLNISDDKILYTGLFCPSVEIENIGLNFLAPLCSLTHTFLHLISMFAVLIAFVEILIRK